MEKHRFNIELTVLANTRPAAVGRLIDALFPMRSHAESIIVDAWVHPTETGSYNAEAYVGTVAASRQRSQKLESLTGAGMRFDAETSSPSKIREQDVVEWLKTASVAQLHRIIKGGINILADGAKTQ